MPDDSIKLIPGKDYYINEQGLWVFTADYLLRRGYCCQSGCRHCPYGFRKETQESTHTPGGLIVSADQMGQQHRISFPPKRIISLVPSQTELLFDLGLDDEIVGITKFCVHPSEKIRNKTKVGGTKKFSIEKIHDLQPDLIIGNKEENYQEGIAELQKQYPVWMSDISSLHDACAMIIEVGRIVNRAAEAGVMAEKIKSGFSQLTVDAKPKRIAYFIWRNPFMVAAQGTFIHEMLTRLGVVNVFNHLNRYPEITKDQLAEQTPDFIFLSSEPYPFSEKHFGEMLEIVPGARVVVVDGEMFSWYGSRLLKVPEYFKKLKREMGVIE